MTPTKQIAPNSSQNGNHDRSTGTMAHPTNYIHPETATATPTTTPATTTATTTTTTN